MTVVPCSYQYVRKPQLLERCASIAVQLLYAIGILTVTNMYGSHSTVTVCHSNPVTISVHTVTNMYGSHSTVTVCHSNPHCHYISAHCYQTVR